MKQKRNKRPSIATSVMSITQLAAFLIKKLRKERGMTGSELAQIMDMSQQQISRYERAITELTLEQTEKFALVFDMTIWQFMDEIYLCQYVQLREIGHAHSNKIVLLEGNIDRYFKNNELKVENKINQNEI